MTLAELFPDEDQKFQMRFARGTPAEYFAPTANHAAIVAERRRWLRGCPETYSGLLAQGEPLLDEVSRLAAQWNGFNKTGSNLATPVESLLALGEFWETDFLLLKAGDDGEIRLLGGCLCFPSHWRLADKLGKSIEFIHAPVPGLNENLGPAIRKFLASLKPGIAWQRVNWGLSRSPELNQHPDRNLPRLDAQVELDEVWLRVEEQALVALPESGGILFGIRIVNHPLAAVGLEANLSKNFARALQTMPDALAAYKGFGAARGRILALLGFPAQP